MERQARKYSTVTPLSRNSGGLCRSGLRLGHGSAAVKSLVRGVGPFGKSAGFDILHHFGIAASDRFVELVHDGMLVLGVIVARADERDVFKSLVLLGHRRTLLRGEIPDLDL